MTDLPELLTAERIRCGCEIRSKKRALQTVAELLSASLTASLHAGESDAADDADDEEDRAESAVSDMAILDALISRERLGSTGIGHGIALPHSRLAIIDEPLAALITLKQGVDFESADDSAVDIVLGLLVPEDCNDDHLSILANLAKRFSDPAEREAVRACRDSDALMAMLDAASPPG